MIIDADVEQTVRHELLSQAKSMNLFLYIRIINSYLKLSWAIEERLLPKLKCELVFSDLGELPKRQSASATDYNSTILWFESFLLFLVPLLS